MLDSLSVDQRHVRVTCLVLDECDIAQNLDNLARRTVDQRCFPPRGNVDTAPLEQSGAQYGNPRAPLQVVH